MFCNYVQISDTEELSLTDQGIFRHRIGWSDRQRSVGLAEARLLAGTDERINAELDHYEKLCNSQR